MSYLDHPVFLCGAPRSGTTLLHTLFDSVKGVVSIPVENVIGDKFYEYRSIGQELLEDYFKRDYVKSFDLQISYNKDYQKFLSKRAVDRFGKHTETSTAEDLSDENVKKFIDHYIEYIQLEIHNSGGLSLKHPYQALASAYCEVIHKLNPDQQRIFVHRRNMTNETQAVELAKVFPQAKFIHLVRDPRTRYLSARERAIRKKRFGGRYIAQSDGVDHVSHRAIASMYSFELAKRNKNVIKDRYMVVRHEDVANNREETMRSIAQFLGLEYTESLLVPTMYGQETTGNSSFQQSPEEIKKTLNDRVQKFNAATSPLERNIINYYCARLANDFGYEMDIVPAVGGKQRLKKLPFERRKDYWKNRKHSLRIMSANYVYLHNLQFERILKKIVSGEQVDM